MELRHLAVFVAVAEELSFSRAADRLHVVQSAVSATVRNLEREWGVSLFHRTTHRVELTPEGRALVGPAREALHAAGAVDGAVDEIRGGLRGTLRLGIMQATPQPGTISVAAMIAGFRRDHPGVDVQVRQGGSATQLDRVRSGELDLAVVGLPDDDRPHVAMTVLSRSQTTLVCHPGHPLAARASVDLAALADEPFADLPPTWGVRIGNDMAFARGGVRRTVAYEINDVATVVDFVPLTSGAPEFVVSVAAPADRTPGPAARAFVARAVEVTAARRSGGGVGGR
jgi:DNA-binding transcriptional LysR family regulator